MVAMKRLFKWFTINSTHAKVCVELMVNHHTWENCHWALSMTVGVGSPSELINCSWPPTNDMETFLENVLKDLKPPWTRLPFHRRALVKKTIILLSVHDSLNITSNVRNKIVPPELFWRWSSLLLHAKWYFQQIQISNDNMIRFLRYCISLWRTKT